MDSLPERIEAAEGPSRELDGLVEVERRKWAAYDAGLNDKTRAYWSSDEFGFVESQGTSYGAPTYTSSIDAAMTLVPEGWAYRVWHSENRKHASATVDTSHPINRACFAESSTPALALCAAALRAKEQPNEG